MSESIKNSVTVQHSFLFLYWRWFRFSLYNLSKCSSTSDKGCRNEFVQYFIQNESMRVVKWELKMAIHLWTKWRVMFFWCMQQWLLLVQIADKIFILMFPVCDFVNVYCDSVVLLCCWCHTLTIQGLQSELKLLSAVYHLWFWVQYAFIYSLWILS